MAMIRTTVQLFGAVVIAALLAGCPGKKAAQEGAQPQSEPQAAASAPAPVSAPPPVAAAAPASPVAPASSPASAESGAAPQAQLFSTQELEALVAPIALYPDSVLSQVLMASTYPLEIVHAARWVKDNPKLKGDAAVKAVENQPWDVSVKSLVAFPQVLEPMSDKLDWTQRLGDAFLAQQKDVLAAVQTLRLRAQKAGNLQSNEQQTVVVEQPSAAPQGPAGPQGPQGAPAAETIVRIEPANPQVVYVPAYNPTTVYGAWPAPAAPPYAWAPYPAYYPGAALASGFAWGVGIAAAGAIFGGCDWNNNNVNVNVNKATNIDRSFNNTKVEGGKWRHDAQHRQGVAYRDNASREQFARGTPGADARRDYRGRTGGANERANVANRAETGNRAGGAGNQGVGNRNARANNAAAANRGSASNRAVAGNRANAPNRGATAGNRAQNANRPAASNRAQTANRVQTSDRGASAGNRASASNRGTSSGARPGNAGGRDSAFQGVGNGAASQRDFNRGRASAQSSNFNRGGGGGARGGGGGGGGGARGGRR